jgi:Fibronectin type III domain
MVAKFSPSSLTVLTLATAIAAASPGNACERPGTPDNVRTRSVTTSSITLAFRNTTRWGEGVCFDYELRDSTWKLVANLAGVNCSSGSYHQPKSHKFSRLQPNTRYTMRVRARTGPGTKGCVSKIWSAYVSAVTLATGSAPGGTARPDACVSGYVWRQVTPRDHVCVTPSVRAQVRADNKLAPQRRVQTKRRLGECPRGTACNVAKSPCKPGFVWREAVPGDYVCVPAATRAQARADNGMANTRRMGRKQDVR